MVVHVDPLELGDVVSWIRSGQVTRARPRPQACEDEKTRQESKDKRRAQPLPDASRSRLDLDGDGIGRLLPHGHFTNQYIVLTSVEEAVGISTIGLSDSRLGPRFFAFARIAFATASVKQAE